MWLRHATAAALMLLVFWLDAVTPQGIAIPVLYIVPTVLFLASSRFAEPLVVAALATVLTVVGFYLSAAGDDMARSLINRSIAIGVEWVTAWLVVTYMRAVERSNAEMRTANEAQQASLRRLQEIHYALDQSSIVAATDQTGRITYVNDKFCEISKYSRDELVGQDHRIINSRYHPTEFIRGLWRTIAQGHVWRGEIRNRAKDGSLYWVDTTIVPFLNERGKPWQYLSIRSDITPRKVAQEKLRSEEALTQLGRLSAVVAHEVRNPLAALRGSLQVLAGRLPPDLAGREIIAPMLARIDALNHTVKDILTYSKPSTPKRRRVDTGALLTDIMGSAAATVPGATMTVTGEPCVIVADPEMIRAVLLNLVLNACYVAGAAPIELRSTPTAGWCDIAVLDRGPGLPPSVREHLFEPFITTRTGGTGLGLAIAHRLTELQGGSLTLDDRDGGGTVANVRLPAAEVRETTAH
jgi:two-component system CheB/CheR fusion protein